MNVQGIERWLRARVRRDVALNWLIGIPLILASLCVLLFTWCLAYMVCFCALSNFMGAEHWSYVVIALSVIPLLFWGNSQATPEYYSQYEFTTGTVEQKVVVFYVPRLGMVSNVNPLAPSSMRAYVKIISDGLCLGPRLFMTGIMMWRRVIRAMRIDIAACAYLVQALYTATGKVSFQDLANSTHGFDVQRTLQQTIDIDGVLFLEKEPAGLCLSDNLRQDMDAFFGSGSGS